MKKRIGVFANGWSAEFLQQIITGIQKEAAKDGTDILLFTTFILASDNSKNNMCQLNLFHLPKATDFDGIIILSNSFNILDEAERVKHLFVDKGVPALSLEVKIDGAAFIGTGNRKGMYDAVEHLITKHGCKKIIYCAGIKDNQENIARKQAVTDALAAHGLTLYKELPGDYGYYTTSEQVRFYLEAGNELPDAFVCANDHMALGAISTLSRFGYNIPEDCFVTGFDYIKAGQATFPMLSTVKRPWDILGKLSYHKILELIEKPDPTYEKYYDSEFLAAESCNCTPSKERLDQRLASIRGEYMKSSESSLMDMFFSMVRTSSTEVQSEEELLARLNDILAKTRYPQGDFCICMEPDFFHADEEEYPERIRGYSDKMNMVFARVNGKVLTPGLFDKTNLFPIGDPNDEKSNLYIFLPMSYMKFIIGYIVFKNDTKMLFERTLRSWVVNLDSFFINMKRFITAQQANRKLKEIYMTDFLTGMYNRTGCDKVLYSYINECKEKGKKCILLFADVDNMKGINDNYGHLNGDLAIKATADALRDSLNDGDWLFGRYGGDEFIAVGSPEGFEGDVSGIQIETLKGMETYINSLSLSFVLSVSVGYCEILPDDKREIADYVKVADDSMYIQKQIAHRKLNK